MKDGVLTGYTSKEVCQNCGYQGMALIFDSTEDYNNFLKSKKIKIKENEKKEIKKSNFRDQRPIGILIISIFLIIQALFVIFIYYSISWANIYSWVIVYYSVIFIVTAIILPYGLIKGKSWAWSFGTILFALSIPIGLIFLYYLTRPKVKSFFGKKD